MIFFVRSPNDEPDLLPHQQEKDSSSSSASSSSSLASLDTADPEQLQVLKPFFIMDWLESIDSGALAQAQRILQSPKKSKSTATVTTSSQTKAPASPNSFLQRSISIGNGWNAKGLKRAQRDQWQDALRCWKNALEIRTQVLGEDHLDTANTANNIGIALGKLERTEEAIQYLQQALEIRKAHAASSSLVAATYHNMGNVYQQANQLKDAIHCFYQSKKLQEELVGPDHVNVARAYISMGHTYLVALQYKDACEAYGDALEVFVRAGLESDHVEVQTVVADIQELQFLLEQQRQQQEIH
jgi:tetratricopeptide (TPR) repeat protein